LLFWTGLANSLAQLNGLPEELEVGDGDGCTDQSDCGTTRLAGFRVSAEGVEGGVSYGEIKDIGAFVFVHGANAHSGSSTSRCQDWGVAVSSLAAIRGSAADFDALDKALCEQNEDDAGCSARQ